jgi:hypothetical protein
MCTEVTIEGSLPSGALDSARVRVASIVPFLAMKGMALDDRLKAKDAWDVYYCLRNYPGGLESVVPEFRPHTGHALIREGLRKISGKFASPDHFGPRAVADFEGLTDADERAVRQRDAFERVDYLLVELQIR